MSDHMDNVQTVHEKLVVMTEERNQLRLAASDLIRKYDKVQREAREFSPLLGAVDDEIDALRAAVDPESHRPVAQCEHCNGTGEGRGNYRVCPTCDGTGIATTEVYEP